MDISSVRPATYADLDAYANCYALCFDEYEPEHKTGLGDTLRAQDSDPSAQETLTFVVTSDGVVVGLATVYKPAGESTATLHSLAVLPGHRNRGHARALISHARGVAVRMGSQTLSLEVYRDNAVARALYTSEGFCPVTGACFFVGSKVCIIYETTLAKMKQGTVLG